MRRFVLLPALLFAFSPFVSASVDPDLLALVPPGSNSVASIDLTRTRNTTFGQFLLSRMSAEDAGFKKFVGETGFDPRQDLDSIVFAGHSGEEEDGKSQPLAIARGNFDQARIQASAKAKGAKLRSVDGVVMYVQNASAFAFPESGVAVMGDVPSVEAVLASRNAPSVLDAGLQKQVDRISVDNDAWFASSNTKLNIGNSGSAQAGKALESISRTSGGMRFGDTIDMTIDAQTRSPQDAVSLADVVRFFSSMLQTQRQHDPSMAILATAIDNMTMKTVGDDLRINLSMAEKDVERLADLKTQAATPFYFGVSHN